MIKDFNVKYSYNDVSIVPAVISTIEHRSECNPYTSGGKLPIFTAPMTTVINEENFTIFEENEIIPILPRNISFSTRIKYALNGKWSAFSLKEFEQYFCDNLSNFETAKKIKVLIDIANGHMKKIYDLVKKSKGIFGDRIQIMVGNIANPETYKIAVESGVDFIRVSIGTGCGCLTTSNVAIHYGIASLINEITIIKEGYIKSGLKTRENITKVIADGGIRNYSDIIKAITLGADYVMIGGLFAKALESAGETRIHLYENHKLTTQTVNNKDIIYNTETKTFSYKGKYDIEKLTKIFYGMASANGQKDLYGKKIKTSEGLTKELNVEYTLNGWVNNFKDFLRSAMSYTNSKTLLDLQNADVIINSNNTVNSINK